MSMGLWQDWWERRSSKRKGASCNKDSDETGVWRRERGGVSG